MVGIKAEGQAALKGKASLLHGEWTAPATFGGWEKTQLARKTLTKLQAQRAVSHSTFKAPPPNVIIIPMNYMNHFLRLRCPHSLMGTIAPTNPQNQRRDAVTVHVEAASQQAEVRPTGTTCSPPSIPPFPLYQLPNIYHLTHCHLAFTEPLPRGAKPKIHTY